MKFTLPSSISVPIRFFYKYANIKNVNYEYNFNANTDNNHRVIRFGTYMKQTINQLVTIGGNNYSNGALVVRSTRERTCGACEQHSK